MQAFEQLEAALLKDFSALEARMQTVDAAAPFILHVLENTLRAVEQAVQPAVDAQIGASVSAEVTAEQALVDQAFEA